MEFLYILFIIMGAFASWAVIDKLSWVSWLVISVGAVTIGGALWGLEGAFWTWSIVMIIACKGVQEDSPSTGTAYVNGKAYNLTERKNK
jgi:hypothetical protein